MCTEFEFMYLFRFRPLDGLAIKDLSVHFSSVTQSCPTLCDPMDCSIPDFPVYHQLPELPQTYVH